MAHAALVVLVASLLGQEGHAAPAIAGSTPAECLGSVGAFVSARQKDEALTLLRRGAADWSAIPRTAPMLDPIIARYELVGKPAAPIAGTRWLNAPEGTAGGDYRGTAR